MKKLYLIQRMSYSEAFDAVFSAAKGKSYIYDAKYLVPFLEYFRGKFLTTAEKKIVTDNTDEYLPGDISNIVISYLINKSDSTTCELCYRIMKLFCNKFYKIYVSNYGMGISVGDNTPNFAMISIGRNKFDIVDGAANYKDSYLLTTDTLIISTGDLTPGSELMEKILLLGEL